MPRDAVSRTANVGTVGKNGLRLHHTARHLHAVKCYSVHVTFAISWQVHHGMLSAVLFLQQIRSLEIWKLKVFFSYSIEDRDVKL